MEIIKIENLTFAYPDASSYAINGVNLTVERGEFITLCGKSGCGKSTLLRHLKPILSPHGVRNGNISFNGKNIATLTQKEQAESIGFVFQNPDNQIVTDKVWHELAFGLESLACPTDEIRGRVAEMASFFGIQTWFEKKTSELSGGQKQLLNLAAVMVMKPSVLILDEPTSQLDPIAAQNFLEMVQKINRELGTTVILSEHRLEDALPMSDKVVVMDKGQIVTQGTPDKIAADLHDKKNPMFSALPTPMRVFYSIASGKPCPVSVRDGRQWLADTPHAAYVNAPTPSNTFGETVVKLKEVWFRYEKSSPDVLKGLSLDVKQGEFYAILGGNGTGKTTALSVIAGLNKPYRGKLTTKPNTKISLLPQNPQSVFVKKTVYDDLADVLAPQKLTKAEKSVKLDEVINFCHLDELTDRHPYDLSGGEQQRTALAKILLTNPDVLLLDEPTKGLDVHFKNELAAIIKKLQANGVTIITVSHDIEFCAKYADRCAMFFNGIITSEAEPRTFFADKSFYTTAANRMACGIIENAVLDSDIIEAVGGCNDTDVHVPTATHTNITTEKNAKETPKQKIGIKNIILCIVFAALFGICEYISLNAESGIRLYASQIISLLFLGLSIISLKPKRTNKDGIIQAAPHTGKLKKRTLFAAFFILLLIPFTILSGVYVLNDKKYYFISLLVILETMLPFALIFEGHKPQARELVIISVLCAIAVAGRSAFAMLPQFKPAVAVVIISGICFGGETGFLVGAMTGFVSNFFFGQGPWTPWQMFAMGIIGFIAGILSKKGLLNKSKTGLCVFGFLSTLIIYGGIMNPATVIIWQDNPTLEMFVSSFVMGLPFDLIHAVSSAFFLFFIADPMIEKLERIKTKYGLIE